MRRSFRDTDIFSLSNILLLLFSLPVFAYLFFSPSLATPAYPQDTFFVLSDGWRFASGQIPYRDYHSALGPLSGLLTGLGMLLCLPGSGLAHGVLIGQGIFLLALLPAAIFVAYRRLRAPFGALFCFLVVSLLASRVALGDPFTSHLTVTGTYNSQGYALLLVFGLMVLLRPVEDRRRPQLTDDILGGIFLLLMFFDKLSYFGAGTAILVAAAALPRLLPTAKYIGISVPAAIRLGAAFAVCTALVLVVFGISPIRIADDVMGLVQAQTAKMAGPSRWGRAPKIIFDALRQYSVILFGFPVLLSFVYGRLPARDEIVLAALGIFLFMLGVGMMMGNSLQAADQFLLLLLAFLAVEVFSRLSSSAPALGVASVSAILVLLVLQHQAVPVLSTVRAASIEFRAGKSANRWLVGTGLADLAIPQDEGTLDLLSPPASGWWSLLVNIRGVDSVVGGELSMYEISQLASEGRCLLDRNATPEDRIYTDGRYYNIFALVRSQPPPQGGSLGFGGPTAGGDFDVTGVAEAARESLADATLIMSPRNGVMPPAFVGAADADSVMKDFTLAGQSDYWSLWRRKGTAHPVSSAACAPPIP
jgi:hypothetical protein